MLWNRPRTRKAISPWDPDPFTVQSIKGSMITVERSYPTRQTMTRNSSFFKLYRTPDTDEDEARPARTVEATTNQEAAGCPLTVREAERHDPEREAEHHDPEREATTRLQENLGSVTETPSDRPRNEGEIANTRRRGRPSKAEAVARQLVKVAAQATHEHVYPVTRASLRRQAQRKEEEDVMSGCQSGSCSNEDKLPNDAASEQQ